MLIFIVLAIYNIPFLEWYSHKRCLISHIANSHLANSQLYVFSITPRKEITVILICWQNVLPHSGPEILSDCSSYSSWGSQASALCIVCCELLPWSLTPQWLQAHIHIQADGVRFPMIKLVLPLSPLSLSSNTPTLYHCQQRL